MNSDRSRFQDDFIAALFVVSTEPAGEAMPQHATNFERLSSQPGFSVYRNTVMKGCIDALQANYPAVCRLVGEEWFRAAAAIYTRAHPPGDSRMILFGQQFSEFLATFPPAAELPYLPGVARIDRFWTEAHCAQDAAGLDPAWIGSLPPEALAQAVLHPHPAARWCWFADQPIYTIWQTNRQASAPMDDLDWKGEGILITRLHGEVLWTALTAGGCAFLDACAGGQDLAAASAAAIDAENSIDFSALIAALLQAGALREPLPCQPHPSEVLRHA